MVASDIQYSAASCLPVFVCVFVLLIIILPTHHPNPTLHSYESVCSIVIPKLKNARQAFVYGMTKYCSSICGIHFVCTTVVTTT